VVFRPGGGWWKDIGVGEKGGEGMVARGGQLGRDENLGGWGEAERVCGTSGGGGVVGVSLGGRGVWISKSKGESSRAVSGEVLRCLDVGGGGGSGHSRSRAWGFC